MSFNPNPFSVPYRRGVLAFNTDEGKNFEGYFICAQATGHDFSMPPKKYADIRLPKRARLVQYWTTVLSGDERLGRVCQQARPAGRPAMGQAHADARRAALTFSRIRGPDLPQARRIARHDDATPKHVT